MPDYLNNEQKLLLKCIGHAYATICALDRLADGVVNNFALERLQATADLFEQTASACKSRALELRHSAARGDVAVTENESKPEEPTDKEGH
jgi:hypothetical protein